MVELREISIYVIKYGLMLNNCRLFVGSRSIKLRDGIESLKNLARRVRYCYGTFKDHDLQTRITATRVVARRARVLHACIALAPACTFHGGTCFGKGRSHFVIAFLPLLPFPSHPKENQATYSSSTRATDLRQLRDLCKPFSLSLSLSRLNYFPRSSLYLYEYLTPSSPFFNLPTPFSFEITAESEKKERERNI